MPLHPRLAYAGLWWNRRDGRLMAERDLCAVPEPEPGLISICGCAPCAMAQATRLSCIASGRRPNACANSKPEHRARPRNRPPSPILIASVCAVRAMHRAIFCLVAKGRFWTARMGWRATAAGATDLDGDRREARYAWPSPVRGANPQLVFRPDPLGALRMVATDQQVSARRRNASARWCCDRFATRPQRR